MHLTKPQNYTKIMFFFGIFIISCWTGFFLKEEREKPGVLFYMKVQTVSRQFEQGHCMHTVLFGLLRLSSRRVKMHLAKTKVEFFLKIILGFDLPTKNFSFVWR